MRAVAVAVLIGGLVASPAWALDINDHSNHQTTVNANTNTNVNANTQGQQQGQVQGQGQHQSANNSGNSQSVKVESSMIPGVAVAPGLAAGGSQVCLGSFSVGLSGPMAGVAFGKTVVDKGCEDRQNAILLYNMGYKAEALELLKGGNERVQSLFPGAAPKTVAVPVVPAPIQEVKVESTNFGQR